MLIPAKVVVGFHRGATQTRYGRVLHIFISIFMILPCVLICPDGQSVSGHFDEDKFHCLVSLAVER